MKSHLIMTAILFMIMIFFPLITLIDSGEDKKENLTQHTTTEKSSEPASKTEETEMVSLTISATGMIKEMTVEEYVYGTVCAEMPASFHEEALKAQAIACYTYMKWLKENADNSLASDITDSSTIHQAFITEDELRERWGNSYDIYSEKVKKAVNSVLYEYLTYENETAMTVYHGLSPGRTISASQVWKSEVNYLQSVTAPGDKLSPDINTEVMLTKEEFVTPFDGTKKENADEILKGIKKNDDFVSEISYKNRILTATDLRSAYDLKSPYFTIKKTNEGILLTVYGKGHGVGMSQYSADYMARQGSNYKEILAHFYKGTELAVNTK